MTDTIPEGFFSAIIYLIFKYWDLFLWGLKTTVIIALVGTVVGLFIGLFIAALRQVSVNSRDSFFMRIAKKSLRIFTICYIQYLRGTPMLVQGMMAYYGLNSLGFDIPALTTGILVVTINTSAYMAEIIRAGIQSIDKGQMEAARAIGMTYTQAMIFFILPQAFKNAIPAIGNEFVVNIKDSSVLNFISVTELFYQANTIGGMYYRFIPPLFIISLIYLILTIISSQILNWVERKLDAPHGIFPSSQTDKSLFKTLKKGTD